MRSPRRYSTQTVAVIGLMLMVLTACGSQPAAPSSSGTAVGVPGDATLGEGIPNSGASGSPDKTMTLGAIADRVHDAWDTIDSVRIVSTGSLTIRNENAPGLPEGRPSASPVATPVSKMIPVAYTVVRESIKGGAQRQVVSGTESQDFEAIFVDDTFWVRGPVAVQLAPGTPNDAWITLSKETVLNDKGLLRVILAPMTEPIADPLATMRDGLRPQRPRDLGPITIDGRACRAWAGADTNSAGTRSDVTFAIDEDGVPCLIETRVGTEVRERTTFEALNQVPPIAAPLAATPVANPEPLNAPHAD